MNQPVFCKIHSAELLSFLKVQSGPTLPPTNLATKACFQWLVGLFSDQAFDPPNADELKKLAMDKFPRLSVRGYKAARKEAIATTGRTDISKAGRRKK